MDEYHNKTASEAKRRQELHSKELDDRRQHEALMAKLKDDLEKEFLEKRLKVFLFFLSVSFSNTSSCLSLELY